MSLNGFDVSAYQPAGVTKACPGNFAIIKATEGTSYVSDTCNAQVSGALASGKLFGLYHFADGGNPTAEADFFVKNIQGYIGKGVLVLDMEARALTAWGASGAKTFLDRVKATTGVTPLIYGSTGNICNSSYAGVAAEYPLWAAAYPYPAPTGYGTHTPNNTAPWRSATIYQYSSSGRLPGYGGALDLDIAYITAAQWAQLASKGGAVPIAGTVASGSSGGGYNDSSRSTADIQKLVGVTADGIYGPATTAAVKVWQKAHGLTADGIWGPASDAKGFPSAAKPAAPAPAPAAASGYNDSSRAVKDIQKLVGVAQDGVYGPATTAAVKKWQAAHGLTADGIWGPASDAKGFPAPAIKLVSDTKLVVDGVWGTATTKALQTNLHVTVDGELGPITYKALQGRCGVTQDGIFGPASKKALQKHVGVAQDGIVGPATIKAMQTKLNNSSF